MPIADDEPHAAGVLQRWWRGVHAKLVVQRKRLERKRAFAEECELGLAEDAALTLQSAQRRVAAKRDVDERRQGASARGGSSSPHVEATSAGEPLEKATRQVSLETKSSASAGHHPPTHDGPRRPLQLAARSPGRSDGDLEVHEFQRQVTVEDVLSYGFFDGPASLMASAVHDRAGLTTAFALSSVASFAYLQKTDPEAADRLVRMNNREFTLIHECAALVLQSKWRVFAAARHVRQLSEDRKRRREAVNDRELQEASAIEIQTRFRGHHTRASPPKNNNRDTRSGAAANDGEPAVPQYAVSAEYAQESATAASMIQGLYRVRHAQALVAERRVRRAAAFDAEVEEGLKTDAAMSIQAQQRRRAVQQKYRLAPAPTGAEAGTTATTTKRPVVVAKKPRRVNMNADDAGGGAGLTALFFATSGALLDYNSPSRTTFWGVRILHAAAIDAVLEDDHDGGNGEPRRLPRLEITRWVQGPLEAVVPTARRSRLPAIDGTTARKHSTSAAADGGASGSDVPTPTKGRLEPIQTSTSSPVGK